MADEGSTIATPTPPEGIPAAPATPDFSEQLGSITEKLESITGALDSFDERISEIANKPAETTPTTPSEQWVPKSWEEVSAKAEAKAEEKFNSLVEQTKAENEAQTKERQDNEARVDRAIDGQVTKLESENILPKITNENDENDPGRVARAELFGLAAKMGTIDLETVASSLTVAHEAGYTFSPQLKKFIKSGSVPSGVNSPVAGPSHTSNTSRPSGQEIVNARNFDEIIQRFN